MLSIDSLINQNLINETDPDPFAQLGIPQAWMIQQDPLQAVVEQRMMQNLPVNAPALLKSAPSYSTPEPTLPPRQRGDKKLGKHDYSKKVKSDKKKYSGTRVAPEWMGKNESTQGMHHAYYGVAQ